MRVENTLFKKTFKQILNVSVIGGCDGNTLRANRSTDYLQLFTTHFYNIEFDRIYNQIGSCLFINDSEIDNNSLFLVGQMAMDILKA